MRRKDFEEYVYVARAMNSTKPDSKMAISIEFS
jgi:hypothetical protein